MADEALDSNIKFRCLQLAVDAKLSSSPLALAKELYAWVKEKPAQ